MSLIGKKVIPNAAALEWAASFDTELADEYTVAESIEMFGIHRMVETVFDSSTGESVQLVLSELEFTVKD